ncbi:MAG TPA: M28 family peptidase [Solirubrobacteraceae bacterium]|nr:M28 family peptidase [Solirubrobacteraceae bacterium]
MKAESRHPTVTDGARSSAELRATIEALASIERRSASEGERIAAEWIAARLSELGCATRIEQEQAYDSYARPLAVLSGLGAAAGALSLTRRGRLLGAAVAAAAATAIADDISNGPRLFRRATMRTQPTWNVVAETGDPEAERTALILAHHDAAPTGLIFDPAAQRWLGETFPGIVERIDTSIPHWWPVVGAPALVAFGAARRRRKLGVLGMVGCLGATAALADISRSPIVPGANDNLTAVAAFVALASALAEQPVSGIRVLLVSCGSEETLQEGIRAFARRHFPSLDRERTWVVNLDTVGSPELVMLEGEGPLVMEDYHARGFRDLVARAADRAGVPLRRGLRARSSTDSVVPSRAGYPTATLSAVDRNKALSNYHLMSDTPDNVDYRTVAGAVTVTEAVIRELAARP